MKRKSISVVIPLYNAEKYIERTLMSVLGQSLQPDEILIVNDGSTDSGVSVAEHILESSRFKNYKIISTLNKGHASAANTGVAYATCDYVALLDSDDTWDKEKLLKVSTFIESNDSIDIIFSRFISIDEHDQKYHIQNLKQEFHSEKFWSRLITEGNIVYGSNSAVVIRRDCFLQVGGYDVNLKACEDWDLWIRLAKKFNFAFIPEDLVYIRVHAGNQSGNKKLMLNYFIAVMEKHIGDIFAEDIDRSKVLKMIILHQSRNVINFYFSGSYQSEREKLSNLFKVKYLRVKTFLPILCTVLKNKSNRYLKK